MIRPSVFMLERGDIFVIDGKWCFAFGGARSHDIQDGILDPADYPDEEAFKRDYRIKSAGMIRVRGISWWDEEMPSSTEREKGLNNLKRFMEQHEKLDFVFTHDVPASDKLYLGYDSVDELVYTVFPETTRKIYTEWEDTPFYGIFRLRSKVTALGTEVESERLILVMPPIMIALTIVLCTAIVIVVIIYWRKRTSYRKRVENPETGLNKKL